MFKVFQKIYIKNLIIKKNMSDGTKHKTFVVLNYIKKPHFYHNIYNLQK